MRLEAVVAPQADTVERRVALGFHDASVELLDFRDGVIGHRSGNLGLTLLLRLESLLESADRLLEQVNFVAELLRFGFLRLGGRFG
ncbi:MAG: hypothetical protein IPF53_21975 [Blastocatellia bacterium]|nr:hypothetical protein [Blastocatellia bacterium]